jgi:5-methylcytosine-specific restriction endonuclease McrA
MPKPNFKRRRIVLDSVAYAELSREVFERDKWKYLLCPRKVGLQAHHLIFRSQGGDDAAENLATLCWICHDQVHRQKSVRIKLGNIIGGPSGS